MYDKNVPMILVTGATGAVGSALIKQLAATDTNIRALTRDPENAAWMKEFDINVVKGNFQDAASLDGALDGIDKAFLLSGIDRDQVELQGNFVEAAQRADIQTS